MSMCALVIGVIIGSICTMALAIYLTVRKVK